MNIVKAKHAGFCFGVNRAVDLAFEVAKTYKNVYMLGEIIHNPKIIEDLKREGAVVIESADELPRGAHVIIRSHGIDAATYEKLVERQAVIHDATCTYVQKIQEIAERETEAGRTLLIAGDKNHPEVKGIAGHAKGEVFVFGNIAELENISEKNFCSKDISVVVQTTFEAAEWDKCRAFIKKNYTNVYFFDTICGATFVRQQEVLELSKVCDVMVIIGGKHSSNTAKLASVAAKNCKTFLVEDKNDIERSMFDTAQTVGIAAGASTPSSIIEEVLRTMNDMNKNEDFNFEEMLEQSLKPVYKGKIITGVVTSISANEVTVDIGTKHTGFIPGNELSDDASKKIEDIVKPGDEITVMVVKVNDNEGTVMLSKRKYEAIEGFEEVAKAAAEGTTVEAYVQEMVKGGLVASVKGIRMFIPGSQIGRADAESLLKTKQPIKVLELSGRRAIGSIKAAQSEVNSAAKEKFWADVEVGKKYQGVVKSVTNYGAFIDLGGVDCLLHISEMSWNRIKHPSEIMRTGDVVDVYVKGIDEESKKVSLGYKDPGSNPWEVLRQTYEVGAELDVEIVSIAKFGAFARLIPGIDALIHISEISQDRVENVADVLNVGDIVRAKLMSVEYDKKRASLSMKALAEKVGEGEAEQDAPAKAPKAKKATVEKEAEVEPAVEAAQDAPVKEPKAKKAKKVDSEAAAPEAAEADKE